MLPAIPGYRLIDTLGQGGMGVVYRAVDERTGRVVALKLLSGGSDSEVASRRFRREFRAAARLLHPHVAQVFDIHPEPPTYYTLELVDGVPLDRALAVGPGGLGDPERMSRLIALVGQILVALDVVHEAELVHRDLKPENVLVTTLPSGSALPFDPPAAARPYYEPGPAGDRPLIKLLDFGLAWAAGDSRSGSGHLTKTGIIVGTVDYISPEQVLGGEVDRRADLYALGVVLFELLAGRPPFDGRDTVGLLLKHAYEEAPSPARFNPAVDAGLAAFTLRLLSKDPADRFPSAREALAALRGGTSEDLRRPSQVLRLAAQSHGLLPPRFVGRDTELGLVRESIARLGEPAVPGVLLVSGESGIGKTRLLEEAKKAGRMLGLSVYPGGAHGEATYAFAAFLPVLDLLARDALRPNRPRGRVLEQAAAVFSRLVPRWAELKAKGTPDPEPLGAAEGQEERYRVFAAMSDVVRELAAPQGMLLVIEDLHWADPASLELLAYLVRDLDRSDPGGLAPVLIVASLRDDEVEPGSAAARLREALKRSPRTRELHLGRLEPPGVEAMARSMLGTEAVPREILAWLQDESQGVPFLIEEMLAAFAAEGTLRRGGSGSVEVRRRLSGEIAFPASLPPSVADLVARRLDQLDERERKVAGAAALVGPEVPFDLLEAASGLGEDDLLDALQILLRRRILAESRDDPDLFLFVSKVVRDVLTGETFERRRRKAHERVVEALERRARKRPEDVLVLAHHSLMGGLKAKAYGYLRQAAAFHRERLYHEEALPLARRALDLLEADPGLGAPGDRLSLLAESGELEAALCNYERAAQSFAALEEEAGIASRADLQAGALLGLADIDLRRGDYVEAGRRTQAALALARTAASHELAGRANTSLGRIAWHQGRAEEALHAFQEALAVERERGDDPGTATALYNIGYAHFARGELALAERHFEESLERFRARGHRMGVARGLEAKATVGQRRGTYDDAARAAGEAKAIMARLGDRRGEAYCLVSEGNLDGYRGRWPEALHRYDEAEATFAELGESRGLAFCASNRGRVLTSLGDYGDALESIGRALKLARKIAEPGEVAFCSYALAEVFRELGDAEEAGRQDQVAVTMFREQGERYGLGLALAGRAATEAVGGKGSDGTGTGAGEAAAEEALALSREAGGMPEVEARAGIALAALRRSPDLAASSAATAAAAGLGEIEAIGRAVEADLAAAAGDVERARMARARAALKVEELACALEQWRESFLRRRPIRRALGQG